MKKQDKKKFGLRMILMVCVCAGGLTIIPWGFADHASILGYYSLCPFSPISTVILFYGALSVHGHIRRMENRVTTIVR